MKCTTCEQPARWEALDVLTQRWFPLCDDCVDGFSLLFEKAHDMGNPLTVEDRIREL